MDNFNQQKKKVIAFGAGKYFKENKENIENDYNIIAFCDNDERKRELPFYGKPVISLQQLQAYPDVDILITSIYKYEIIEQLINAGIDAERIAFVVPTWMKETSTLVKVCDRKGIEICIKGTTLIIHNDVEEMICREIWYEDQYNINLQADCIVIDIGLNVGFASLFFANKQFVKKIYAFEPDKKVYEKALYNISLNKGAGKAIETFNVACSDGNRKERYIDQVNPLFVSAGTRKRRLNDSIDCSTMEVECIDSAEVLGEIIDRHLGREKIIVKCDCEGAEYEVFYRLEETGYFDKIDAFVMEWHIGRRDEIEKIFARNDFIYFISTVPGRTFGRCYAVKQSCKV